MSKVAAIQMVSSDQVKENLQKAASLIQNAVKAGAQLVVLPENFAFMRSIADVDRLKVTEKSGSGVIQDFMSEQAKQHRIWIVAGTIPLETGTKVHSACLVFDDQGQVVAQYNKIHLFDATVSSNEQYTESDLITPGTDIVVLDTPVGRLGLSICYDLRFPELFRALLDQGAEIIAVPSAFTETTGRAHWEVLLRARAIENLSYLIAAGQGGQHVTGRQTFGHSMIIDPWGKIIDSHPQGEGVVLGDIDLQYLHSTRHDFPSIKHRRI